MVLQLYQHANCLFTFFALLCAGFVNPEPLQRCTSEELVEIDDRNQRLFMSEEYNEIDRRNKRLLSESRWF